MHDYVKKFELKIYEASDQSRQEYDASLKKYQDAVKKDGEEYQKYVDGKITRDAYMASFMQFLETEKAHRLAQVKYKLDSARGAQAENANAATAQPEKKQGTAQPAMPGTAPNNPTQ